MRILKRKSIQLLYMGTIPHLKYFKLFLQGTTKLIFTFINFKYINYCSVGEAIGCSCFGCSYLNFANTFLIVFRIDLANSGSLF